MEPAVPRPVDRAGKGQDQAENPARKHCWRGDVSEEPPLHHLERLGLLGPSLAACVIDKKPRQVEQPRHPGDDRDDVEGLDIG